jgi:parallel beta-helix repeat protein
MNAVRRTASAAFVVVLISAAWFAFGPEASAVGMTPSTTTLESSMNPNVYGQSVTFTASVTGGAGAATGTVTFFKGSTAASTKTLASGTASYSTTLPVGSQTITATYNGDATYAVSTSPAITQVTNKTPTTTTLGSSANPAVLGNAVTLTAFVAATPPGSGSPSSGTVRFYDGTTQIGSGTPSAGTVAITVANLTVGSHALTAAFGGSASYQASTSAPLAQVVDPIATTTALTAGPNPAALGVAVTLTATVASSGGTPTGSVTFSDGSTALGAVSLSGGQASLSVSDLATGDHTITAAYAGNGTFGASSSTPVTETIGTAATSTSLVASPDPAPVGDPVTFTATVAAVSGSPTGTVTFSDGADLIGSAPLASGQASISTSALAAGDHAVTATYGGDADFASSTSPAITEIIGTASTVTQLTSSPDPSVFGATVTFSATVSGPAGSPTGTVTFSDGATVLGGATVAGGQAAISVATLAIGDHTIVAAYSGDGSFASSTSTPVTQTVTTSPTTTGLSASPNPVLLGGSVTFTATVTAGIGTPTGSVTFSDGTTVIGTGTLSGGQATLTTAALGAGSHSVSAAYGGDATYAPSTSSVLTETVSAASSTTTLASTPNPSTFGDSVTFTATVASSSGVPTDGSVTFSDGSIVIGLGTVVNGQASASTAALAAGTHAITASYGGSAAYGASTSSALTETVNPAATTTALAATPNPATAGTVVSFTATVTSSGGTPSGSVAFLDGTTAIGTGALTGGQATFATSALTAGTHTVTASYVATANFTASTSAPVSEVVNAGSVLYVDRSNVRCTNTGAGAGSATTPYCTIGAAAAKATAGFTVVVAAGTYPESVSVKNSGTATAPITFVPAAGATVTVSGGTNGFALSSKSWIVVRGFTVTQTSGPGIVVSGGSNVTVDGNHVSVAGQPVNGKTATGIKLSNVGQSTVTNNTTDHNSDAGIYVTGSNNNTIRNNTSFSNARGYVRAAAGIDVRSGLGNLITANVCHDNEDSGFNAWTGTTTGTNVFSDNLAYANGDHGIDVHDALNNRIVANTVYGNYDSGIEMTTSTGTVLANNISVDNGINSARTSGNIRADSASAPTSTVNDDLISLRVTGVMVDWNGVKYSSLTAFRTATGQESRGIQADPRFVSASGADFHLLAGSPAIDAGNSGAPGQPLVDFAGAGRYDDPATPNTGIGPVAYADRGAFEYLG